MTSKERVKTVLRHEEPDRVPVGEVYCVIGSLSTLRAMRYRRLLQTKPACSGIEFSLKSIRFTEIFGFFWKSGFFEKHAENAGSPVSFIANPELISTVQGQSFFSVSDGLEVRSRFGWNILEGKFGDGEQWKSECIWFIRETNCLSFRRAYASQEKDLRQLSLKPQNLQSHSLCVGGGSCFVSMIFMTFLTFAKVLSTIAISRAQ